MATTYDCVIIGSGPGGYETAIRASQLGLKTAIVEKNKLGGVCLNIGCIPTKALLKSAEVMAESKHISDFGLNLEGEITPDFPKVIERSRGAASQMNKGVQYLMRKNDIDVHYGYGRLAGNGTVEIVPSENMDGEQVGEEKTINAEHIIIATGARPREIPPLPIDEDNVVSSTGAMTQTERPDRLVIVGAGAIGVEFGYFYKHMGTDVTIIEVQDRIVPAEDADVSKELKRSFKKAGINVMTGAMVQGYEEADGALKVEVETDKGTEYIEADQILSAVGVVGNVEDIGLEELGVETNGNDIVVDEFYRTNVDGVYAIGDVTGAPWLAHKASHEGIICVEKIAGEDVRPMDKKNIPGCTYCQPQIASVGYTEEQAEEAGYDIKVGKFPFKASGKAAALGHNEGFVKIIYDKKYGELLGCHIIGHDATELIAEVVTARTLETTGHEIMEAIHPHPTLSESIMEATRAAYGEPINI
ncbi:dihydrolipoyl dehydrogenase [Longibacter salinarum]|uniref:Dihydrolipoyl dehydrogenase n=1 Tax=Longibacter salinarum TaxID=1850348 RepID=A0A2A8D1M2_9BACT|nr:dihydrolipoyl dehydrogenase [Longibacter salinarum]PEN14780.1 dihydrolipoyl dehydrogenase [Longibacter salinarum]